MKVRDFFFEGRLIPGMGSPVSTPHPRPLLDRGGKETVSARSGAERER